jgi:hypothetical protein
MENINIGCKLPHGIVLEIGSLGKDGVPGKDYRCAVLQGTLLARKGARYGTALVPRDLWETWVAKNKAFRYVVDGSVFVVK